MPATHDPIPCVLAAATSITTNVDTLVSELNAALTANGDTTAKVIGLTYPDVILGDWVFPAGPQPDPGRTVGHGVRHLINPTL